MTTFINRSVSFAKPFIDATRLIFKEMVQTDITTGKPSIKEDVVSRGDVSAIIGMSGKYNLGNHDSAFQGQMVISFPMETYIKCASAMLMEEYKEYNDELADVGAEICNMVMGNAKGEINKLGYKIDMAVPNTVIGKDHIIKYPNDVHIIVIPIECKHGMFFIELCYQDVCKD